ncbi:MAG: cytochrome c biogenesis protein CcdA [Kiritimatiellia bacterium]
MKMLLLIALLMTGALWAKPTATDPFFPDVEYKEGTITLTFAMKEKGMHLYDDMFSCSLGAPLSKPSLGKDADGREMYAGIATFVWTAAPATVFTVNYQGCDIQQCYMPQSYTFTILQEGTVVEGRHEVKAVAAIEKPLALPTFRRAAGFIPVSEFVRFLKDEQSITFTSDPVGYAKEHGIGLFLLLIFIGGLALNLTPCVLPMMPINLAIIGAGASGGGRLSGALRGGAYGLGIALAYGVLALIPALTGTAFGAVQSSPWFNATIAVVFVLLALALFDVFMIDFTRFSGSGRGRKGAAAAFIAGAVSAVLAGACVAPVLIAVLLITSTYFAEGAYWALCLPFVLGLGMAAPWPIAGAGLSFLPKPGAWMVWVKKLFGILVLLFAAYYGWVAFHAFRPAASVSEQGSAIALDGTDFSAIQSAISAAHLKGKAVFIDFWGTACKNCEVMEATTFKDEQVKAELERFCVLKVRMELTDKAIQQTQERFGIMGLPTYLIADVKPIAERVQ